MSTASNPRIFASGAYMARETLLQMVSQLFDVKAFNHNTFSNIKPSQITGEYTEAARSKNLPQFPAGTVVYHTITPSGLGAFGWQMTAQPANTTFNRSGHILFNAGSIFRYNWSETRRHLGITSSLYGAYDSNGQAITASSGPATIVVLVSSRGKYAWVLVRNGTSANLAPVIASLQRAGYNVTFVSTPSNQQPPTGPIGPTGPTGPTCPNNQTTTVTFASTVCSTLPDTAVSCDPKTVICMPETKDINPFSNMIPYFDSRCSSSSSSSDDDCGSSSTDFYANQQPAGAFCAASQCQQQLQPQTNVVVITPQNQQITPANGLFATMNQQPTAVAHPAVAHPAVTPPFTGQMGQNNIFQDQIKPTNGPFRNRIDEAALEIEQDIRRARIDHNPQNFPQSQVQQAYTTNQPPPRQVADATRAGLINYNTNPAQIPTIAESVKNQNFFASLI